MVWIVTYQHLNLGSKGWHVTESSFRARRHFMASVTDPSLDDVADQGVCFAELPEPNPLLWEPAQCLHLGLLWAQQNSAVSICIKALFGFFGGWRWFVYVSPNSQAPMCLVCWCQDSRFNCKPVRKSLGVVLSFFLSSHSRKIWVSKLWVWGGSWRAGVGVLPAALAVAGLGQCLCEGRLAGAWQTASPCGFPCWRPAGHGDLLSSWHGATQGLSWPWFSEDFCLASWHLTLGSCPVSYSIAQVFKRFSWHLYDKIELEGVLALVFRQFKSCPQLREGQGAAVNCIIKWVAT